MDRTAQGLKPRFLHQAPPTDAEVAAVLHKMSQRVIRKSLRHLKLAVDPPPLAPAQQAAFAWGA